MPKRERHSNGRNESAKKAITSEETAKDSNSAGVTGKRGKHTDNDNKTIKNNSTYMKKLFTLLSAILIALAAPVAAGAQEGFTFGYCSDNITGYGFESADEYYVAAAIKLTEKEVAQFDGASVTAVNVGFGSGRNKNITIFFTYGLGEKPFYEQEGRTRLQSWCEIPVTTPVKIEKDKPFYIGYIYHVENLGAKPIGCDENTSGFNPEGAYISAGLTTDELAGAWSNRGDNVGNVCLRATIKSDKVSEHSAMPTSLTLPVLAYPGREFEFGINFTNTSNKSISSVEGAYQIGEDAEKTYSYTLTSPVEAGKEGVITLTAKTDQDGFDLPMWATITKVNGEDNDMAGFKVTSTLKCTDKLFQRKVYCEKFSGVSCGYCPRGIVAFEYMMAHVPQTFIPVTIQNYQASDPMYCSAFSNVLNAFPPTGAPCVWINHDANLTHSADGGAIQNAYQKSYSDMSNIGISVDFEKGSGSTLDVTATVEVGQTETDTNYAVGFVLTEDHVGPYSQFNGYDKATGQDVLEGWTGRGQFVTMYYDHVARNVVGGVTGIEGSVPSLLEAGKKYTYTLNNFSTANVSNIDYANIIALLIDTKTKKVVNADFVRYNPTVNPIPEEIGFDQDSGVNTVEDSEAAVSAENGAIRYGGVGEARVYTVAGAASGVIAAGGELPVAAGLYIVATPEGTVKVIVK